MKDMTKAVFTTNLLADVLTSKTKQHNSINLNN